MWTFLCLIKYYRFIFASVTKPLSFILFMEKLFRTASAIAILFIPSVSAMAQQAHGIQRGVQAIQTTTTDLKTYFDPVVILIYVVAAVTAVIGGYRVFSKWQSGDQDVQKSAMGWVGSILFLLAIAALLRSVFLD